MVSARHAPECPAAAVARIRIDIETVTIPPQAPKANAYAERWVRTVRTECLDWVLIWNLRHLEHVLTDYVAHYHTARPQRGIDLDVPVPPKQRHPRASRTSRVSNGSMCSAVSSTNTATPPNRRRFPRDAANTVATRGNKRSLCRPSIGRHPARSRGAGRDGRPGVGCHRLARSEPTSRSKTPDRGPIDPTYA
jgi:hypothetical protein